MPRLPLVFKWFFIQFLSGRLNNAAQRQIPRFFLAVPLHSYVILFHFCRWQDAVLYSMQNSMCLFFIYLFFLFIYFCLCGILDSPEHLLTVILAAGSADIDCQRDVSFLLFISSFLGDAAECKSAFSPWRWGDGVGGWGKQWWRGEMEGHMGWGQTGGTVEKGYGDGSGAKGW